jgi:hypothetical protein
MRGKLSCGSEPRSNVFCRQKFGTSDTLDTEVEFGIEYLREIEGMIVLESIFQVSRVCFQRSGEIEACMVLGKCLH